jgi:hypothetical protein
MESPHLPASSQLVSAYQSLLQLPSPDLLQRYTVLQQALRASAIKMGKLNKTDQIGPKSFAHLPREQMAEELMVDYVRVALGKRLALSKEPSVAFLTP